MAVLMRWLLDMLCQTVPMQQVRETSYMYIVWNVKVEVEISDYDQIIRRYCVVVEDITEFIKTNLQPIIHSIWLLADNG